MTSSLILSFSSGASSSSGGDSERLPSAAGALVVKFYCKDTMQAALGALECEHMAYRALSGGLEAVPSGDSTFRALADAIPSMVGSSHEFGCVEVAWEFQGSGGPTEVGLNRNKKLFAATRSPRPFPTQRLSCLSPPPLPSLQTLHFSPSQCEASQEASNFPFLPPYRSKRCSCPSLSPPTRAEHLFPLCAGSSQGSAGRRRLRTLGFEWLPSTASLRPPQRRFGRTWTTES